MKKIVLTFGLISGAIVSVLMMVTMPFADRIGSTKAEILGYTTIILSALMIFFGIRSYRENISGGRLTFLRGFAVGILIALVSSACYVATWEVVYYKFLPDFADKYAAGMVSKAKAAGATPEKLQKVTAEAEHFKVMYNKPAYNIAMTFLEIFPVCLLVTLLSALLLRRKSLPQPA